MPLAVVTALVMVRRAKYKLTEIYAMYKKVQLANIFRRDLVNT